jgi:ribosomal protein S18 acetylase RimI-like enzyme
MKEQEIEFRQAGREDLPSLLALYRQLNPEDEPAPLPRAEELWEQINRNGSIFYFVAADGGKIAAACFLCIIPNLTRGGRPIGFIENVVTDGAYRRRGLGKAVMEMAVDHCRRSGCYKALLQSGIKRTEAHRFYEAIGFDGASKKAFEIRFE